MRNLGAAFALLVLVAAGAGAYFYYKGSPASAVAAASADARLARLEALGEKTPASPPAGEEDWRAFADALAGIASVEIGTAEGGVARDVVITLADDKTVGVRIEELRAWGVNSAAAAGGDVRLAERIDARGVEFFGLGELIDRQTAAYMDALTSSVESLSPEAAVELDLDTTVERYDVGADRILVDGLIIHPRETTPEGEEAEAASFLSVMKAMAAGNLRTSFDAYAVYGMRMAMRMEQTTGKTDMTMTAPVMAAEGWRRGDLDFIAFKEFAFAMDMTIPATETVDEETGDVQSTPEIPMQMGGGYDFLSAEGIKLSRLYAYIADGVLPPASETDLMSLGVWRILGERQTFGGREFSSVREATADLSKFHWLIPTDVRFTAKGGAYNMSAFLAYVGEMARVGGGEDADLEQFAQVEAAFKESGLDVIPYDFDMTGTWNPKTGATASRMDIASETVGDWRQSFEGSFPDFEGVTALLPPEGEPFDWTAAGPAILEAAAFQRGSVVLTDRGGLDKGFALAVAMAKLAPEDDAGAAMLRNADPADLRISSAAMMRMAAPQAAQAVPQAAGYITALADFVQKGGALRIEANPPEPVTAALLGSESEAIDADPGRVAELLGLSVVHEPAEGKAGKK